MAVEPVDLAEVSDGNSQLRLFLLHHNPPIITISLLIPLNLLVKLLILRLLFRFGFHLLIVIFYTRNILLL